MKKIGILGGTFNPPHIGHLIVANEVKEYLQLDEVWLMPTATPPHKKDTEEVTASERLAMTKIACASLDGVKASNFEVERGGVSYTFDTMAALKKVEENKEFYFIIGGDMIDTLHTWYRIDDLVEIVTFVGVNRPNTSGTTKYPILHVKIPDIDLSSTMLRNRLKHGRSVQLLVPEEVERYIEEEGLYGHKSIAR